MPQPVPDIYLPSYFSACRVGRPVASAVGLTWAEQVGYLLGRNLHEVGSATNLPAALGVCAFRYARSPGAQALLVQVRPRPGTAAGDRMTIAAAVGGAGALANTTHMLDGSTSRPCAMAGDRIPDIYYTIFDVTGLTVGTAQELTITTAGASGTPLGIYSARVAEIPRAMLDPATNPSTDAGLNWIWPRSPNFLFAGTAATTADAGAGFERVMGQLDSGRTKVRRYPMNWCTLDNDTYAASTASGVYADLNWHFSGAMTTPRWYTRAKRLDTSATANTLQARIRHKAAAGDLTVRIITTPVGGSSTNNDVTCASSGTYTTTTGAVTIATDGTNQEAYIEVQAKIAAGTGYVSAISLHDNES